MKYKVIHCDPSIWMYDSSIEYFDTKEEAMVKFNEILSNPDYCNSHNGSVALEKIEKLEFISFKKN